MVKPIYDAVKAVKQARATSRRSATRKLADTPMLFGEIRQPDSSYLLIPRHSSENRRYIPIGIVDQSIIAGDSNLIMPNATLFHFGILQSNVHMAWMRAFAGRLEMRYRYSANIIYNNFPWPNVTDEQVKRISSAANQVLLARNNHKEATLADLYDDNIMPKDLLIAHRNLNKLVMNAYGFSNNIQEEDCVAELIKFYSEIISDQ